MPSAQFDLSAVPLRLDENLVADTWYRCTITGLTAFNSADRVRVTQVAGEDAPDPSANPPADSYGLYERFNIQAEAGQSIWAWTEGALAAQVHYLALP